MSNYDQSEAAAGDKIATAQLQDDAVMTTQEQEQNGSSHNANDMSVAARDNTATAQPQEDTTATTQQQQKQQSPSRKVNEMSAEAVVAALKSILTDVTPSLDEAQVTERLEGVVKRIEVAAAEGLENHHLIASVGELTRIALEAVRVEAATAANATDMRITMESFVPLLPPSENNADRFHPEVFCQLRDAVDRFSDHVCAYPRPSVAEAERDDQYRSLFASISPNYAQFLARSDLDQKAITMAAIWDYLISAVLNESESALWAGSMGKTYDRVRPHMACIPLFHASFVTSGPSAESLDDKNGHVLRVHCSLYLRDLLDSIAKQPGLDWARREQKNEEEHVADALVARFMPLKRGSVTDAASGSEGAPLKRGSVTDAASGSEGAPLERAREAAGLVAESAAEFMRIMRRAPGIWRIARTLDTPPPTGDTAADSGDGHRLFDPELMGDMYDVFRVCKDAVGGWVRDYDSMVSMLPLAKPAVELAVELVVEPIIVRYGRHGNPFILTELNSVVCFVQPRVLVEGRAERCKKHGVSFRFRGESMHKKRRTSRGHAKDDEILQDLQAAKYEN